MDEQWMNDLRKKMANHKAAPPKGLWEDIERAVNEQAPAAPPTQKRVWLWTAGWGTVAAAIALFFWLNAPLPTTQSDESLALTTPEQTVVPSTLKSDSSQENSKESAKWMAQTQVTKKEQTLGRTHTHAARSTKETLSTEEQPMVTTIKNTDDLNGETAKKEQKLNQKVSVNAVQRNTATIREASTRYVKKEENKLKYAQKRAQKQYLSMNLYAANFAHSSDYRRGYGELVAGKVLPENMTQPAPQSSPAGNIIYSNRGKEVHTYQKHKLPIKIGLAVRYHFTPRFSIESGLTYAHLSSELTSGTETSHYVTHQKLEYLGIPILLNFDIWKNRHWNFYVSGGGMLEKCIHGSNDTDFILNQKTISTTRESVMEHPVQWAINGAVGAQFNLSRHLGLYAEPGVSYYFDNGSPITTIYKDQPLNFNFKLGFRFTFN